MAKPGPKPVTVDELARRGTLEPYRVRTKAGKPRRRRKARIGHGAVSTRDYLAIARTYAADVLADRLVACRLVRQAVERQERDRHHAVVDPTWPYAWSDPHAIAICAFAETLVHVEGKWDTPTIVLQPWQVWMLTTLFGWRQRDALERRRFTDAYIEVARKNGKSVLAAAVMCLRSSTSTSPGRRSKSRRRRGNRPTRCSVIKKMVARLPALRGIR